jgi:hypothetical protein
MEIDAEKIIVAVEKRLAVYNYQLKSISRDYLVKF